MPSLRHASGLRRARGALAPPILRWPHNLVLVGIRRRSGRQTTLISSGPRINVDRAPYGRRLEQSGASFLQTAASGMYDGREEERWRLQQGQHMCVCAMTGGCWAAGWAAEEVVARGCHGHLTRGALCSVLSIYGKDRHVLDYLVASCE